MMRLGEALLLATLTASLAPAQELPQQIEAGQQVSEAELDQLLAPIALYPDTLVGQILMAATYPLEVVEADRWLQDADHAALTGDQLTEALDQKNWDPSIKSLVPFPQILRMMDDNLDWMERLGQAFQADQAAVMDSVQRLRKQAEATGRLRSTPQTTIGTEGQAITIVPSSSTTVYLPVYNPTVAYGPWPYPDYPPDYFPNFVGGFVDIVVPLWGWHHCDWDHHRIDIDRDRWEHLNHGRQPVFGPGGTWQHDPSRQRGIDRNPNINVRFPGNVGAHGMRPEIRANPREPLVQQPRPTILRPRPTAAFQPLATPYTPPKIQPVTRGPVIAPQAEHGPMSHTPVPVRRLPPAPAVQHAPTVSVVPNRN